MNKTLSYEQARDELVAVVQKLESGGTSLQESIELWERGEELAATCQRWLDGARARFDAAVAVSKDSVVPGGGNAPGGAHAPGGAIEPGGTDGDVTG